MIKAFEKKPLVTLSILTLLMLLVHLDVPNITIMEARNFITAREMVNDNNWLLTTLNGEARYQKPPLPTWLTAISGFIFGMKNLFALRLPTVLMVLFSGIYIYYLSLKLKLSKTHSLQNSLIFVTSLYIIIITTEAPWDIFTYGFMIAGLCFLFQFLKKDNDLWRNAMLSALFIGLSALSKGPVSIFTVLIPFLISYSIVFKFKDFKKKILHFSSLILTFTVIGGWWFVYVRLLDSEAFFKIISTETNNWSTYNVKPFYYYWSFFTQSGLWTIPAFISLLYPYLINKVKNKKAYKFTFWWTISSFVLLSIMPEKKIRYIVPVLIPLALNTGFYIEYLISNFSKLKNKKETLPVYLNFGLIAVIGIASPLLLYLILEENVEQYFISYLLTSLALLCIGLLMLLNLHLKKINVVFYLSVLFMVSLTTFRSPILKSLDINEAYNSINSLHQFEKTNNITTYTIGEIAPELLWNYNGILKDIYKNNIFQTPLNNQFGLLIMNKNIKNTKTLLNNKYNMIHIETYNLNHGLKKKERLIRQFYLVSKK